MKSIPAFILTLTLYVLVMFLPIKTILPDFISNTELEYWDELIKNSVITIFAIFAVFRLQLLPLAGLSNKTSWNFRFLTLIPGYLILIGLIQLQDLDISQVSISSVILLFFSTLSIGFSEEFIFRGVIQSILLRELISRRRKKSMVFLGVMIPALIFGLLHLLNFKANNAAAEISQFLYATFIGIAFGAILLRTNKLIPLAIIHGLIDFVFAFDELPLKDSLASSGSDAETTKSIISAIVNVIVTSPLFIAGILVIRKIELSSIVDKLTLSDNEK